MLIVLQGRQAQPPSGGCELKRLAFSALEIAPCQPPSGGCELKPAMAATSPVRKNQPPSGGCELKPTGYIKTQSDIAKPAAFGRL